MKKHRVWYEFKEVNEMGMFNPKNRKIITAIIAIILVLAMVVPTVLSLIIY